MKFRIAFENNKNLLIYFYENPKINVINQYLKNLKFEDFKLDKNYIYQRKKNVTTLNISFLNSKDKQLFINRLDESILEEKN